MLVVQPHLLPLLVQVMGALLRAVREVLRIREAPRAVQTVEHLVVRLGARMVGHLEGQTVECRVVRRVVQTVECWVVRPGVLKAVRLGGRLGGRLVLWIPVPRASVRPPALRKMGPPEVLLQQAVRASQYRQRRPPTCCLLEIASHHLVIFLQTFSVWP